MSCGPGVFSKTTVRFVEVPLNAVPSIDGQAGQESGRSIVNIRGFEGHSYWVWAPVTVCGDGRGGSHRHFGSEPPA